MIKPQVQNTSIGFSYSLTFCRCCSGVWKPHPWKPLFWSLARGQFPIWADIRRQVVHSWHPNLWLFFSFHSFSYQNKIFIFVQKVFLFICVVARSYYRVPAVLAWKRAGKTWLFKCMKDKLAVNRATTKVMRHVSRSTVDRPVPPQSYKLFHPLLFIH